MDNLCTFRHVVVQRTLTQGVTVRRDFEGWFRAPEPGKAREISLLFGSDEVQATLHRPAGEDSAAQVRYVQRRQLALREWLCSEFSGGVATDTQLLEFTRVKEDAYRLSPMKGPDVARLHLCIGPRLHHNDAASLTASSAAYVELENSVNSIRFDPHQGQAHYNAEIRQRLAAQGWECDQRVVPDLPLQFDFRKDDLQVEVEFGNARTYYQDCLKFLLPFTRGMIRVGLLLVPTSDFARVLCHLGSRRASRRPARNGQPRSRLASYTNMITYEKVMREFEPLRFIMNMPLMVCGVDFWGCTPAAAGRKGA